MEATIITLAGHLFTVASLVAAHVGTRVVIQAKNAFAAHHIPLDHSKATALYVRRDRRDRQRAVNVFDGNGNKVYTIERKSRFIPNWSIYEFPSRKEIATLHPGFMDRSVDFHHKPDIQHREMIAQNGISGRSRHFYLQDGAPYEWSRMTRFLERVVNNGGGSEEVRERVARARLMRQFRFDYELLIDESKIDREVVLATAFLSMITEWGLGHKTRTTGPTAIPKNLKSGGRVFNPIIAANKRELIEASPSQPLAITNHSESEYGGQVELIENRIFLLTETDNSKY
ncbi:hypothetical protein AWJ20_4309 [Sugiyamaella lignohabitans]|uniref:Uncharacterized protein n=1 Tax=Sugiyamaella lignohabitans TaxID=796027 RepID=A0A167CC75_9ASCO|nr:uncharacterized protein AWJ20_4309 [Sugiyamaella lignohabitans]ANB11494.1 hypothetical protein AWJ20_4309 [Sugiyamaella lignohabitans]